MPGAKAHLNGHDKEAEGVESPQPLYLYEIT